MNPKKDTIQKAIELISPLIAELPDHAVIGSSDATNLIMKVAAENCQQKQ